MLTTLQGQDFYFYKNLPIRWVRVVGIVVDVNDYAGRRVFTVDDSSGICLEASASYSVPPKTQNATGASRAPNAAAKQAWMPPGPAGGGPGNLQTAGLPYPEIDVGSVVDVKGKLATFRGYRQIRIERMGRLRSTAEEVALWEKRAKFQSKVLGKPWVLSEDDIAQCRKEAEAQEDEGEDEKKRRRLREAIARVSTRDGWRHT